MNKDKKEEYKPGTIRNLSYQQAYELGFGDSPVTWKQVSTFAIILFFIAFGLLAGGWFYSVAYQNGYNDGIKTPVATISGYIDCHQDYDRICESTQDGDKIYSICQNKIN